MENREELLCKLACFGCGYDGCEVDEFDKENWQCANSYKNASNFFEINIGIDNLERR